MRAGLLVLALAVGCGSKQESQHLKRAKELVSVSEWANARTELKLELKDHPKDLEARALMVYVLDRTDALPKADDYSLTLVDLHHTIGVAADPHLTEETRKLASQVVTSFRQGLFDQSIDTKDATELNDLIERAARIGFGAGDDDGRKSSYAAVLAETKDTKATAYLVEQLKSKSSGQAQDYLFKLGKVVTPALRKAVEDPAFLGHAAALDVLAHIEAKRIGQAMTEQNKNLVWPKDNADLPGVDQLGAPFVSATDYNHAHTQYAAVESGAKLDGVLLVQESDAKANTGTVELYAFKGGEMTRVHATHEGKPFELSGPSAVTGLAADGATIVMHRYHVKATSRDVETGPVDLPAVGMAVKLKGYAPVGKIVREDGGLWVVHVNEPIDGMTELTVAENALIGLEKQTTQETSVETIRGDVDGDVFVVRNVDAASVDPLLDKASHLADNMCGCSDSACADRVHQEMWDWVQTLRPDETSKLKADPALKKSSARYAECLHRANGN